MMDNNRNSQSRRGRKRRTTALLRCEMMERRQLLSTLWVTNTNDDTSAHSLRWAVQQANSDTSSDTIDFNIAGSGPVSIRLTSPLPELTNPVMIDGTTEPGYDGAPLVQLDGSGLSGTGNSGLILSGGGSTIQGLAIVGFSGAAIVLESGNGDVVAGNYLGVTPGGTKAVPNGQGLAILGSSFNTVGSGSGGAGNVISGNTGNGILIQPQVTESSTNQIGGNWIGTTADGAAALGNSLSGIAIEASSGNIVGSAGQGLGNVVSGNLGAGISVSAGSTGTMIQNNTIGLAEDGKTPLGNGGDGIQLDDAPDTVIGGTEYSQRNAIGSNDGNGINTSGQTTGLLVAGNDIGTDSSGLLRLGNLGNGISLGSSSNTIGGTGIGAANVIEFNGTGSVGAGVELVGDVNHDQILSNSIYGNAGLGINLGSGPTPNHAPGTVGPNDYQNYPTLTIAQSDAGETTIQGTLYESPNSSYLVQFFSSPTEDASGHGQGKVLIGSSTVTTDSNGNGTFSAQVPTGTLPGQFISATATSLQNDTSEFASDVAVQGQINLELTASGTPDPVQAGGVVTYSLTVANQGFIDAHNVVLNDTLPGGVSLESITSSQGFVVPTMSPGDGHGRPGDDRRRILRDGDDRGPDRRRVGRLDHRFRDDLQRGAGPGHLRRIGDDHHDGPGRRGFVRIARREPGPRPRRRRPDLHDHGGQPGPGRRASCGRHPARGIGRLVRLGQHRRGVGYGFGRPGRRRPGQSGGEHTGHGDRDPPGPRRRRADGNGVGLR
jgi:uncharacterized repeat protein (TIGR01451 family)